MFDVTKQPSCEKLGTIKLQFHLVNKKHSDPTLELIQKVSSHTYFSAHFKIIKYMQHKRQKI